MKRLLPIAALLAALVSPAAAQYAPFVQPDGSIASGVVNLCATGTGKNAVPCGTAGTALTASPPAGSAYTVQRTNSIGTTGVLVSAADTTNRRTLLNNGSVACELVPASGAAYGTGFPLAVNYSFTFDSAGRTTAALYVACASSGGSVAVLSY